MSCCSAAALQVGTPLHNGYTNRVRYSCPSSNAKEQSYEQDRCGSSAEEKVNTDALAEAKTYRGICAEPFAKANGSIQQESSEGFEHRSITCFFEGYSHSFILVLRYSEVLVTTMNNSEIFWTFATFQLWFFRDSEISCHDILWDSEIFSAVSPWPMAHHHVGQRFTQVSESAGSLLCLEREARFLYGHEAGELESEGWKKAGPKMSWSFGGKPSRNTKTKKWGIQWNLRVLNGMEQYILYI